MQYNHKIFFIRSVSGRFLFRMFFQNIVNVSAELSKPLRIIKLKFKYIILQNVI